MARLRIAKILDEHKNRCGSLKALRDAIKTANKDVRTVEHRKLSSIVSGEPVSLTDSDLDALDTFLTPFGQSLSAIPLLVAEGALGALVEKGEVNFLTLVRVRGEEEDREYTSVWDLRAFGKIAGHINHRWPTTQVHLREEAHCPADSEPQERQAHWAGTVEEVGASCCCLGSPFFGLSEYMLAEMFGVTPFRAPSPADPKLPFYFIWYPPYAVQSECAGIRSHFSLTADDLQAAKLPASEADLPQAINDRKAQALVVGNEVYAVHLDRQEWTEYGVIVAQRREEGQIWLVVAGQSGPGTFAAADWLVGETSLAVPESKPGEISRPVYAVVEVAVRKDPKKTFGDVREVMGQNILVGPQVWEG